MIVEATIRLLSPALISAGETLARVRPALPPTTGTLTVGSASGIATEVSPIPWPHHTASSDLRRSL